MIVKKKFKSKKNEVYLVEENSRLLVKKSFTNNSLYEAEKNFYLNVSGNQIHVPELISFNDDDHELKVEYINGITVLSKIEDYERNKDIDKAYKLLIKLIKYLKSFSELDYIKTNELCFYDLNLRNFLIYNDSIVGIDFEDIRYGSYKQDIAKLLAMLLFYDPTFTEFKTNLVELVKLYIEKECGISMIEMSQQINDEISEIKRRRGLRC